MNGRINALATLLSTAKYDDVGSDVWYGVVSDKRKLFESESKKKDDDCIDSGITTHTSSSPIIKQSPQGGKEQQSPIRQQDQLRQYQRPAFVHQSPLEQQFQLGLGLDNKRTSFSTTMKDENGASKNSIATEATATSRKNEATLICLVSLGCHDRRQSSNQNRSLSWLTTKGIPFVIVDGNDLKSRDIRDELFIISGIRGYYPQFFIERQDGQIEYFGNFDRMETINETSGLPTEVLAMHPELETWADITFESTNVDDEVTEVGNQNIKHSSAVEACDNTDGDCAGIQSTEDTQLTVNDSTAATSLSYSHSDSVDNNNSNSGEDSSQRLYLQPNFLDQFSESLSEEDEGHITGIHTDEEFDKENGDKADEVKHDNNSKRTINRDVYRTLKNKTQPIVKTAVRPSLNVQVDDLENMANGVFSPRGILSYKAQSIPASEASPSSYDSRISHGHKSSQAVAVLPHQSISSRMRLALSPRSIEGRAATNSTKLVCNSKVIKGYKCNIPKSPRSKPPQSPRIMGTNTFINTPPVAESPRSLLQDINSFDTADFCHDFDEEDTDNEGKDVFTSTADAYEDRSLHAPENVQSGSSNEDKMQGQDMNMTQIYKSESDDLVDEEMILLKSNPPAHNRINEVDIIEMEEEAPQTNNLPSMHQQMQLTASIIERFQNDIGSVKTMMNQDGSNIDSKEAEDLLMAAARLARSLDRFLIVERQDSSNNNSTVMTKVITLGKQDEQDIHSANESILTRPDALSGSTDVDSSCNEPGESTLTIIEKLHPTPPRRVSHPSPVKDLPALENLNLPSSSHTSMRVSPKLKEKPKLQISIGGFQEELNLCEKQEDIFFVAAGPSPCGGDDKSLFNGSITKRTKNTPLTQRAKNILRLFGMAAKDKEDSTSFHTLK